VFKKRQNRIFSILVVMVGNIMKPVELSGAKNQSHCN